MSTPTDVIEGTSHGELRWLVWREYLRPTMFGETITPDPEVKTARHALSSGPSAPSADAAPSVSPQAAPHSSPAASPPSTSPTSKHDATTAQGEPHDPARPVITAAFAGEDPNPSAASYTSRSPRSRTRTGMWRPRSTPSST
ncbi:hypothetical protein [Microbacterium sp. NIBRBAC000506063]|uniref:hypothetical protein n=1 Tax=Microbacterium sp. NIBRBAC000506063 TaxID=2734618 RepID=UPI001BB718E3|nr:hypothetical protein [Microbacterium sp. NIBRBAC000506063]QTV79453.1 hypothetical protein KAE78_11155 [Microbacterium sp. NIBRBAC000506063]